MSYDPNQMLETITEHAEDVVMMEGLRDMLASWMEEATRVGYDIDDATAYLQLHGSSIRVLHRLLDEEVNRCIRG